MKGRARVNGREERREKMISDVDNGEDRGYKQPYTENGWARAGRQEMGKAAG